MQNNLINNPTKEVKEMTSQEIEMNDIPQTIEWNGWQAPTSFGFRLKDQTEKQKEIAYLMNYTNNLFESKKTTEYLNENTPKLWFWKHVALIFSIGVIYEEEDKQVLDAILKYFNKKDDIFIPNTYKIFDYRNELIKNIEKEFDIGNGNYHFMLVPFVTTDDEEILKNASESIYSSYGPLTPFVDLDNIVSYIIEINSKYGAIKSGMTEDVAKILHVNLEKDFTQQDEGRSGTYGQPRKMEYDPGNKRVQRQGFLDFATGDGIDSVNVGQDLLNLINPVQQADVTTAKQWFDENEEGIHYRHDIKPAHRKIGGLDFSQENLKDQRFQGKKSLYNQIVESRKGLEHQHIGIIPDQKTVHYKIDDFFETTQNRKEKPSYQIYDLDTLEATDESQKVYNSKSKYPAHVSQINKFVDEQKGKTEVPKPVKITINNKFEGINKNFKGGRVAGSFNIY